MKIKIEDIAIETGCSKATVSSILKGGGTSARFSNATRERVLEAAEKKGYRTGGTRGLGFFYFLAKENIDLSNWSREIGPFISSASDEAVIYDKFLSCYSYSSLDGGADLSLQHPDRLFSRRKMDGMIVCGQVNEKILFLLSQSRLPFVLLNTPDPDARATDAACFDELFTGMQATRFLLDKGHRRILHVRGDFSRGLEAVPVRRRGYELTMREGGLEPWTICPAGNAYESFVVELKNIVHSSNRPTAVLTDEENAAVLCYRALRELGISYKEISLLSVAWSNKKILDLLNISHLELPALELGRLAVQMLVRKLDKDLPIPSVLLRGVIRELASTPSKG